MSRGLQRRRVRRRAQQQRADELALAHHVRRVAAVRVRVARVVTRELAALHVVVGVVAENVAGARDGDAAAVRHDLQAVARQLQIAEDLGPQQAAHVGAVRVDPALLDLAADRRAADPRVALEHQHLEAGAREIGGIGQAVVAGADDDGIVALHRFAPPAQPARCAALGFVRLVPRRDRPPSRIVRAFRARQRSSCASQTNQGSRESGSHSMPRSCSSGASAS